jgi:hypothetical protein
MRGFGFEPGGQDQGPDLFATELICLSLAA